MKFLLNALTNHNSAGFSALFFFFFFFFFFFNTRLNELVYKYIFDNWYTEIIILNHLTL